MIHLQKLGMVVKWKNLAGKDVYHVGSNPAGDPRLISHFPQNLLPVSTVK